MPLSAQSIGGPVQPRGALRVDVENIFAHAAQRFSADGREPAGAWFQRLVGETVGEVVTATASEINLFFAATGGVPAGADAEAAIGDLRTQLDVTTRHVPVSLRVGVLPRTEATLAFTVEREQVLVQNFVAAGGTLGTNPNPTANAELLASVGPRWESLGRSALLPTESSPLGIQLRQRVMALTGRTIALPTTTADVQAIQLLLTAFPEPVPTQSGLRPWRVGDLEVGARVLVLSTFGEAPYPEGSGEPEVRLTASVAARLPTGRPAAMTDMFTQLPTVGQSGFRAGSEGDLFAGRFWLNGSANLLTLRSRSEPAPDASIPATVVWDPATELLMRLAPRYRLAQTIAMGARYELARSGSTRRQLIEGENSFTLESPAGSVQRIGLDLRFTTLPTIAGLPTPLRGPLALEAGLSYLQTIAAPPGVPAVRSVILSGSLTNRLWGGRAQAATSPD